MTANDFATTHGDPATWTTNHIETQQNLALADSADDNHAAVTAIHPQNTDRTPSPITSTAA
ncbi:hypothetical protein F0L17_14570 [Streptomyces sp. TRM43335]|uniref:Uncharacterized protein n=1 Tax=Streptomyces taklimakanensis TaxID=2569853 RepID=A0A6G2BE02_9ACTN|nr:hypothetical protein [Streptomyces taklimakanensis]MTE20309.1 hypothetical protein [Streptomyces taklimakanensis]